MERDARFTISANSFHPGSKWKFQWERLLGSFQSTTASTKLCSFAYRAYLKIEAGTRGSEGTKKIVVACGCKCMHYMAKICHASDIREMVEDR
jgi:hypothetical protein